MAIPLSNGPSAIDPGFWLPLVLCVVMAAVVFVSLRLLSSARTRSEEELQRLYHQDVERYLERLENNRLLRLVFRAPVLTLYKLEGYMKKGDEDAIETTIRVLDRSRLQPRDRVQFLQKRLSYYVQLGDDDEARASRDALVEYLGRTKAIQNERYRKMAEDADQIIGVYVDRDTSLLLPLREQAAATSDPTQRGILQYRLAKLYHYEDNDEMTVVYLKRAQKNLQKTYYEVMIKEALQDRSVLDRQ